ncbi:MAG: hypothetical protein II299_06115 [Alistipes sp.]|nr:hypothetical protein [Alistipes sp.]
MKSLKKIFAIVVLIVAIELMCGGITAIAGVPVGVYAIYLMKEAGMDI